MVSWRSQRARGRVSAESPLQTTSPPAPQGESGVNEAVGESLSGKYQLAVSNVPRRVDFTTIRRAFEKVLRSREGPNRHIPIHFTLKLDPRHPKRAEDKNSGTGVIYLNGKRFAKFLAARVNEQPIRIGNHEVLFQRQDGSLSRALQTWYARPTISRDALRRKKENQKALSHEVRILSVQFGVEGRDGESFSIEWEGDYNPDAPPKRGRQQNGDKPQAYLKFNQGREGENPRSLQIEILSHSQPDMYRITIPMDQISTLENARDAGTYFIFMRLESPPSFEKKNQFASSTGDPKKDFKNSWERLSSLEPAHERVVAFASRALRLAIMPHSAYIKNFIEMSYFVKLPTLQESSLSNTAYGEQYSRKWLDDVRNMIAKFPWPIAFQCDVLLRRCLLLPREILKLKREIGRLVTIGTRFAEEVLKRFIKLAPDLDENEGIVGCLRRAEEDCNKRGISFANLTPRLGVFRSRHVLVTPTSYELQGPEDEQSNRVIRLFGPAFEDRFIRVAFADEGGTLYRRDGEVDNSEFIARRVGAILNEGLEIAGRRFEFLAYSGSGLRQHSVWFVSPFRHPDLGDVNAQMIRNRLGDFSRVIKCPARYAARIAQAFSATDPSVEVKPDEIEMINDVETETQIQYGVSDELKARKYVWTDGHGTISPDLADEIWARLCEIRPKRVKISAEIEEVRPRAYQIRLGGYKGVVSVDYRLKGRLIRVRPSMDKFDAPDSLVIEISDEFNRPRLMYLNRPLIMLLETLGVKHSAFIKLQDKAIDTAKAAFYDPDVSADLMKMYDLGEAFELPRLLRRLGRYRLQDLHSRDPFVRKLLSFSLYHIKREIKYHARLPVPGSWTVVGVADVHDQLEDGEIFACIHQQGKDPIYLEGPILICRSPTIHPGDVQLVKAIGKPKPGSAYDIENLANTVVFSVKGKRPLPSCLGGGDLDGDVYYLITNTELHPIKCEKPASYEDAERQTLDRDSTVKDIADFVIEYMTHDTLGLIGVNHLRLADQRPEGVLDKDCLRYAKLHSDAVDYPKTGKAVTIDGMPKPSYIPDWYCPESSDPKNGDYYESDRALGVLFRGLQLGDPEPGPIERPVTQEDVIRDALQDRVLELLNNHGDEPVDRSSFEFLFARFSHELNYQCAAHSLAQSANSALDEEEVVIGTILRKTAAANQSRKRKILMDRLAKQSRELVRTTKREILGDRSVLNQLARAWNCLEVAWELAKDDEFGHKSFALVALTSVLDVLDEIRAAKQDNSL